MASNKVKLRCLVSVSESVFANLEVGSSHQLSRESTRFTTLIQADPLGPLTLQLYRDGYMMLFR